MSISDKCRDLRVAIGNYLGAAETKALEADAKEQHKKPFLLLFETLEKIEISEEKKHFSIERDKDLLEQLIKAFNEISAVIPPSIATGLVVKKLVGDLITRLGLRMILGRNPHSNSLVSALDKFYGADGYKFFLKTPAQRSEEFDNKERRAELSGLLQMYSEKSSGDAELFLRGSVENNAELIEKLSKNRLGQQYLGEQKPELQLLDYARFKPAAVAAPAPAAEVKQNVRAADFVEVKNTPEIKTLVDELKAFSQLLNPENEDKLAVHLARVTKELEDLQKDENPDLKSRLSNLIAVYQELKNYNRRFGMQHLLASINTVVTRLGLRLITPGEYNYSAAFVEEFAENVRPAYFLMPADQRYSFLTLLSAMYDERIPAESRLRAKSVIDEKFPSLLKKPSFNIASFLNKHKSADAANFLLSSLDNKQDLKDRLKKYTLNKFLPGFGQGHKIAGAGAGAGAAGDRHAHPALQGHFGAVIGIARQRGGGVRVILPAGRADAYVLRAILEGRMRPRARPRDVSVRVPVGSDIGVTQVMKFQDDNAARGFNCGILQSLIPGKVSKTVTETGKVHYFDDASIREHIRFRTKEDGVAKNPVSGEVITINSLTDATEEYRIEVLAMKFYELKAKGEFTDDQIKVKLKEYIVELKWVDLDVDKVAAVKPVAGAGAGPASAPKP